MEIKRVMIGGNREEINRETGEHTPNLIESVKRADLIFTPEQLIEKMFKGTPQEYNSWLIKHKLHPSQINYHDINQKQELLKSLKNYAMRLLDEAKVDSLFYNELGNIVVSRWLNSFDILENHIYDFGDFDKIEFIKIAESFKKRFTTHSPFAFLTIDEFNQQIKVVESHKVLIRLEQKLPMGIKRSTPVGQSATKLYQNFFTTIGYKGRGELTEGLNYNRTSFKNFNFNLNTEIRLLNDIIYDRLGYDKKELQMAFIFGATNKRFYFESDIKGTERTEEELEALAIAEGVTTAIAKELHKKRQGSIAVDKTVVEVKKRVEHPKIEEVKLSDQRSNISISSAIKSFEKEMFVRQQGYAELAKEKINDALANREKYIREFYAFLKKGMSVSDALGKFSERYANNPYIKGIIETSITGELQLQALKDKGIEELYHNINLLKGEKLGLVRDLDIKETEIASLNQKIESLVVTHTKQLEEIESNVGQFLDERAELVESNNRQSEMIEELEKLIVQYEETLKIKDREIADISRERRREAELLDVVKSSLLESNWEVESLENDKRILSKKIENYDSEIKHYIRQIEQLKEENSLILSATDLLKTSNKQLESQLEMMRSSKKDIRG